MRDSGGGAPPPTRPGKDPEPLRSPPHCRRAMPPIPAIGPAPCGSRAPAPGIRCENAPRASPDAHSHPPPPDPVEKEKGHRIASLRNRIVVALNQRVAERPAVDRAPVHIGDHLVAGRPPHSRDGRSSPRKFSPASAASTASSDSAICRPKSPPPVPPSSRIPANEK